MHQNKILVLGIGNVMFGDEGVGVHFVKMMERNYKFSSVPSNLRGEKSQISDAKFDGAKFNEAREVDNAKFDAPNLCGSNLNGDPAREEGEFDAKTRPLELEFMDGGTLALALTPAISRSSRLIVVDCISAEGGETGDVYFFDYESMPPALSWNGSAHEVEMLETLRLTELAGDLPQTKILAVVPKRIEPMSFELSPEVQRGVNLMEKTLLDELVKLGFEYEKIADFSIARIAEEFANKGAI